MDVFKRMLSPNSDSYSPPKQRQRLDRAFLPDEESSTGSKTENVILQQESISRFIPLKDTLTHPDAPDFFNNSMRTLEAMLAPLEKISGLYDAVSFMAAEAKDAKKLAETVSEENKVLKQDLTTLRGEFAHLESKYDALHDKLLDQENYSRRDNLVFGGIPESQNENILGKVRVVLKDELKITNADQIKIVRCHRLRGSPLRPKPVIVRFHFFQDRQLVWENRNGALQKNITIKENFAPETESRRRIMFPIMLAAKQTPGITTATMSPGGKLKINSESFTVKDLDKLPAALKPDAICHRENDKTLLFWGKESPYSNFYPSPFSFDGKIFNCVEQFLCYSKAVFFKDQSSADAILQENNPAKQKDLGRKVKNFNRATWKIAAEEIMETGIKEKFDQNPLLQNKLQATRGKVLAEATKRDTVWGTGVNLWHKDALDSSSWHGQSLLGKILMKVRDT